MSDRLKRKKDNTLISPMTDKKLFNAVSYICCCTLCAHFVYSVETQNNEQLNYSEIICTFTRENINLVELYICYV